MKNIYFDHTYISNNPTWHAQDSPWKAEQIARMLEKHRIAASSIAEIGCGVGEVLVQLQDRLPTGTEFDGFDIAPEAIVRAKLKEREHLRFRQDDLLASPQTFDVLLAIDVFEHVPDYLGFLEGCTRKARYKIYHIPLDIHVSSVIRGAITQGRYSVGHLHYFSAESALASLVDTGHRIIDCFYTDGAIALYRTDPTPRRRLANVARRALMSVSTRWAARLVGGYSLLVLAE
jgi:SAM-dependent methyltransferase